MQRVLVLGSGGAGKSTVAGEIGARLALPVVHLDQHYWRPGWIPLPPDEWALVVSTLAAGDRWVIDGNYRGTVAIRLARADTVVLLDLPRALCLAGVLRRRLRYRGRTRPAMAPGCAEQLDREFIRLIWTYPKRSRPGVLAAIERAGLGERLIRLRSPRAVNRWLAGLG